MPRVISRRNTIIDYIDAVRELAVLNRNNIQLISLNKFEWMQLLNLRSSNFNDCRAFLNYTDNSTSMMYHDILIYWDGTEDTSAEYTYHLESILNEIEERQRPAEERNRNNAVATDGLRVNRVNIPIATPRELRQVRIEPLQAHNYINYAEAGPTTTTTVHSEPRARF